MTDWLLREGLWDLATGTESFIVAPLAEDTDYETQQEKYLAQRKRIQKAIGILRLGMTDAIAVNYYSTLLESPLEIWEDVRRDYKTETGCDPNHLQMELYECQLEDSGTGRAFINKLNAIKDKLIICGQPPTHSQMAFHLFNGLPKTAKWTTCTRITKAQFSSTVTNSDYIKLQSLLTAYEVELKRAKSIEPSQGLFVSGTNTKWKRPNGESGKTTTRPRDSTTSQKFTGNGHKCGKKGHREKAGWSKGGNGPKKSGNMRGVNMDRASIMDEQIWLTEDGGRSRDSRTTRFCSVMATTPDSDSRNSNANDLDNQIDEALSSYADDDEPTWVLDSGVMTHITSWKDIFLEGKFTALKGNKRQITTATGELVPAAGVGNIRIPIWVPGRGNGIVQLCDVLYVQGAGTTNLISVSQLAAKGMNINLRDNGAEVYRDGLLSAIVIKVKRMYTLVNREVPLEEAFTMSRGDDSQLTLWYKRFGHIYANAVLKMSSKHLVSGMPILQSANGHHQCQSCLEGKMTRLPFRAATQKTTALLQLIHSDLCGPMKQKSLGGSLYFMLVIDDYTKFTAVYFLKKKSEAAACFKNYKAHVEKVHWQKGNQYVIKAVRTDSGGEFTGGGILRELEKCGIEGYTTVPYTPQEDEISENGNPVLVGRANTLLKQAGASNSYWAEAIQTCVYLKNI